MRAGLLAALLASCACAALLASCAATPAAISAERARTPRGQVTVIEFIDFECGHCRVVSAELAPLLAKHRARFRVVRHYVPLAMHAHAMDAARAAVCAEPQGKADAVADALFRAELGMNTAAEIAVRVGADEAALIACMADPKTDQRIDADLAMFRAAGGTGVPTIWIDDQELVGEPPPGTLERVLDRALVKSD